MIHYIFDPSRIELDITSKATSCGHIRHTLIHALTGYRFECLSDANEEAVMKDLAALRVSVNCTLQCIFIDFKASLEKANILKNITIETGYLDEARPLHHMANAKKYAARLGSALVSAYLPLEPDAENWPEHPEWQVWEGAKSTSGSPYGRPPFTTFNDVVALLTRNRRIVTAQVGAVAWRHHQDPWDIIAYSTNKDVIEAARDFQKVTYG